MDATDGVSDASRTVETGRNATESTARPLASTRRDSVTADADDVPMLKKISARMAAERIKAVNLRPAFSLLLITNPESLKFERPAPAQANRHIRTPVSC